MATVHTLASANFLSDAAHLLREAAPETSAHLMRECAHHLSRQKISVSDTYRQHVCTACGHIMLPGYDSSKMDLNPGRRQQQRLRTRKRTTGAQNTVAAPGTGKDGGCKTLTCGRCNGITRVQLPTPAKSVRSKTSETKAMPSAERPVDKAKPKPAANANASSKRRAKNRKAGLQALLSSQQKPSNGLSLASFMK